MVVPRQQKDTGMARVEAEELRTRSDRILSRVRDEGETIEIAEHGQVFARLVPVPVVPKREPDTEADADPLDDVRPRDPAETLAAIDRLAKEIAKTWPMGVSATDAVNDVRRDL